MCSIVQGLVLNLFLGVRRQPPGLDCTHIHSTLLLQVKAADYMVLESYCRFVITAAKALGIDIGGR